jgi:hypothetical protein
LSDEARNFVWMVNRQLALAEIDQVGGNPFTEEKKSRLESGEQDLAVHTPITSVCEGPGATAT